MVDGKLLIIDICGDLGFFKISEVTRATISYPFTRTSIIGIIGAILGKPRNSYWDKNDPLGNLDVAIQMINPIQRLGFMVNYTHSKYTTNVARKINTYLPTQSGTDFIGFVTNVRLDYLRNIHYRVFIKTNNEILYNELKSHLIETNYVFPPYLGHANLLADINYLGESTFTKIDSEEVMVHTIVSTNYIHSDFLKLLDSRVTIIMDIPLRMKVIDNSVRETERTGFMYSEDPNKPIPIKLKSEYNAFSVKRPDTKEEIKFWGKDEVKNVIFIPTSVNS